jgi:hypothetical protein
MFNLSKYPYLTISMIIPFTPTAAIPLQALTGPEGSRTLRLPDLKTQHAHPQYSIDCSSTEHLSEGTRKAP